jgi:excisionase family DNA binding protein
MNEPTHIAEIMDGLRAELEALKSWADKQDDRLQALEGDVSTQRDVLDVKACARLLGVHPRTITRRIKEGRIPCTRVGGDKNIRIIKADLFAAMRKGFPPKGTPRLHSKRHHPQQSKTGT